jgi:hypothetical protein
MKDKKMMLAIIAVVVVIAATTAIITVANSRQDLPQPQPEETSTGPGAQQPEEEPEEPEEPTFVDGVICPLGGEMIERADLYPRPVAVMLDNHPAARPQAGLEQAEVVYEILAEGNITRYLALYMHGADQIVGPVRSARSYYIDKCMEYNAIYLHAGGSPEAWDDIARLKIPSFNAMHLGKPLYWREKHRKEPHNIYTALDKIQASAEGRGYNKTGGQRVHSFAGEDRQMEGERAEKVTIAYPQKYSVSYEYSKDDGVYLRYVSGKPHVDENNNDYQVKAKNIIIQRAVHKVVDSEGRRDINLVGSGKGYYITNGAYVPITWQKADRRAPTYYYLEDGKELVLNPGKTWIQVIPTGSEVTFN